MIGKRCRFCGRIFPTALMSAGKPNTKCKFCARDYERQARNRRFKTKRTHISTIRRLVEEALQEEP